MSVNWTWPKATALTTVQSVASSMLTLVVGHSLFDVDWGTSLSIAGATGLVTLLRAVVAYTLPAGAATALVSASVSAAQDAKSTDEGPVLGTHDARGARG